MKRLLLGLTALASLCSAAAAPNPLLPRPQQIHYGAGALPVNGLAVRFASTPSTEDRFTAEQLATRLSNIGRTQIAIGKGHSVEPLAKVNVPTVVAPGVWNWNEIFPDYHRSFRNINGLTATGRKYHTLGILNTGWTDDAQTIYGQSLPGLALGAVAGWQAEPVDAKTFFADYCAQMYPAAVAVQVAPALEERAAVGALV